MIFLLGLYLWWSNIPNKHNRVLLFFALGLLLNIDQYVCFLFLPQAGRYLCWLNFPRGYHYPSCILLSFWFWHDWHVCFLFILLDQHLCWWIVPWGSYKSSCILLNMDRYECVCFLLGCYLCYWIFPRDVICHVHFNIC